MNILITGAAGFLGSHLVEHFLREGHNVIGVDNLNGGSLENFNFLYELGFYGIPSDLEKTCKANRPFYYAPVVPEGSNIQMMGLVRKSWNDYTPFDVTLLRARRGVQRADKDGKIHDNKFMFTVGDCRNFELMQDLMENVDVVYHCAATAHEGLSVFSPSLITKNIYESSVAVFSAACARNVKRIVFMSSMARYGKGDWVPYGYDHNDGVLYQERKEPFHEYYKPNPVDPYGIAKVAAEETLKCLCETHGVEYVIAVPHNIIGTRQNYTDPHRNVASIMMNRIKQGKDVIIYGDGKQTRCFSPIADNIQCLARMAELDDKAIVGQVINIGPDRGSCTINELAERIYRLAGKVPSPVYYPDRPREVKHASCSSDKARKLLGYVEQQDLDTCLLEMWNSIPEGGKPFIYENKPLEIINEKTPKTWTKKLI